MSFLSWLAEWAEKVPAVGWAFAYIIEKIEEGVDYAYGWLKDWIKWLKDSFYPWVKEWIDWLKSKLDAVSREISEHLKPQINLLTSIAVPIHSWWEDVRRELDSFVSNPFNYINKHIPLWIKEKLLSIGIEVYKLWTSLSNLWSGFNTLVQGLNNWFWQQLEQAKDWVWSWVKPLILGIIEHQVLHVWNLYQFIKDPKGYIEKVVVPKIEDVKQRINSVVEFVNNVKNSITSVILNMDDFLKTQFLKFLMSLLVWFLWTFLCDLAILQYDPETKKVYGKPKNPVTHFLIWFFELEEPEYPYESVEVEVLA